MNLKIDKITRIEEVIQSSTEWLQSIIQLLKTSDD